MKQLVLYAIAVFTIFNICVSAYMEYMAIAVRKKCTCVADSYHWYVVTIYFAISIIFLSYSMMYIWHWSAGKVFFGMSTLYTIATLVFVISGFRLTTIIKSKDCPCQIHHFDDILWFISLMRTIMTGITLIAAGIWLVSFSNR